MINSLIFVLLPILISSSFTLVDVINGTWWEQNYSFPLWLISEFSLTGYMYVCIGMLGILKREPQYKDIYRDILILIFVKIAGGVYLALNDMAVVAEKLWVLDFSITCVAACIVGYIDELHKRKNPNQEANNAYQEMHDERKKEVAQKLLYSKSEKNILKSIIKDELKNLGENAKKITTTAINSKKNVITIILGVLTFVFASMYFFNVEWKYCLICEAVILLVYLILQRSCNIINVIAKRAKKNPDEDISQMILEVTNNKKNIRFSTTLKTCIAIILALVASTAIFSKPRLLFCNYGDGYAVIRYTKGLEKQDDTIVIPDTYKGKDVVSIEAEAFKNTSVKSVKLPEKLKTIKYKAFYNCLNLESIDIPQNVVEIRASAFENCTNLKTVSLPNGLLDIRASAFKNDVKLAEIELPESLEYIGASAFYNCRSLTEITIPDKVFEINGQTFEYCTSLKTINLHDGIISIHGEAFKGDMSLKNIILPSKITEIRGSTFEGCKALASIEIPYGVTRIGGHAFYGCEFLSDVSIPDTVLEIGSSAFRRCTMLYEIRIPWDTYVNDRAFKESPTVVRYY